MQGKPNTTRSTSRTDSSSSTWADIGFNNSISSSHSATSHLDFSISPAAPITSRHEFNIPLFLSPRVSKIPIAPPDPRGSTCIQSAQPSTTSGDSNIPPAPSIRPFLSGTWNARKAADKYGSCGTTATATVSSKSLPLRSSIVDSDRVRLPLFPQDVAISSHNRSSDQAVPTTASPSGAFENDDEKDDHYHKKLVKEIRQIFAAKNTNKNNCSQYAYEHDFFSKFCFKIPSLMSRVLIYLTYLSTILLLPCGIFLHLIYVDFHAPLHFFFTCKKIKTSVVALCSSVVCIGENYFYHWDWYIRY